jgi:hypothetical protein
MDAETVRATLQHDSDLSAAGDEDTAHEIHHPDAVLEFPQPGERFAGVPDFLEWRRDHPATTVDPDIRRVRGGDDVRVVEMQVGCDGGPHQYGVDVLEFRGDEVSAESVHVMAGWGAPEWRARWRTP